MGIVKLLVEKQNRIRLMISNLIYHAGELRGRIFITQPPRGAVNDANTTKTRHSFSGMIKVPVFLLHVLLSVRGKRVAIPIILVEESVISS